MIGKKNKLKGFSSEMYCLLHCSEKEEGTST